MERVDNERKAVDLQRDKLAAAEAAKHLEFAKREHFAMNGRTNRKARRRLEALRRKGGL